MRTILQRISDGDTDAIGACLDEYGDLVWRLASRYLDRAPGEVEDAVQEAFVEIWLAAGRFDPSVGSEAAFVATIAHRRLTDYQRRVTVRRSHVRAGGHPDGNTRTRAESRLASSATARETKDERASEALDALRTLPEDERHALWLWLYRGLTHRQISEASDAPIGTVKSRLRRGMVRIGRAVGALGTEQAGREGGAS